MDLVVLDYEMPVMNGCDVAERIREQGPEMPSILYAGFIDDVPTEKLNLFTGVVSKPNCVELLNLIAATHSLRIVGTCFIALSAYIGYEAFSDLVKKGAPERSVPGTILACASLVTMPLLSRAKKKVGEQLGSAAMHADARQTDFCVYLSAILLAGLLLNAAFGWWWADPTATLIMVPIIAKEGLDALAGRTCRDSC